MYVAILYNKKRNIDQVFGPFHSHAEAKEWHDQEHEGFVVQGVKCVICHECMQNPCVVTCNQAP
jgi:hypothetical protein